MEITHTIGSLLVEETTFTLSAPPRGSRNYREPVAYISAGTINRDGNARRLAACWNACEHIATDDLIIMAEDRSGDLGLLLFQHNDGRSLVSLEGSAAVAGDPGWHRVGPVAFDLSVKSQAEEPPITYTWRTVASGTRICVNSEGADVGHVYATPNGMSWCGEPWGRERNHFNTPAEAVAWVEKQLRR